MYPPLPLQPLTSIATPFRTHTHTHTAPRRPNKYRYIKLSAAHPHRALPPLKDTPPIPHLPPPTHTLTCASLSFTPLRYITDSAYAVLRHSRPRILNI